MTGGGVPGSQWTIRRLGDGEVAFVCNGNELGALGPSWNITASGPTGVYNAAIRNFAAASELPVSTEPVVDAGMGASAAPDAATSAGGDADGGADGRADGGAGIPDGSAPRSTGCRAVPGRVGSAHLILPAVVWLLRRRMRGTPVNPRPKARPS